MSKRSDFIFDTPEELTALKNTVVLNFTLTLLPGEPIDNTTLGSLKLESKSILYFEL